ncbi:acetyl-CoA carboxylase biotin carboxyl carrier protein [Clostridium sp. C105KSO13]|uniref:acetyl-CoA carboxylase biotin carboxyl carrier protein n=1 Tax=Clostridium sp. C105KSO13 TaxID=1776045 RepID=UPI00074077BA|nr:acetyl-CoA carboxylase biotin carboxyl carrier protein [Clostridium sp. C105KSO13]CUX25731.1 Biotin carboxyl carrier protein of acetyl-CoA carboxylase [Clostridium sp. C105KSO13]
MKTEQILELVEAVSNSTLTEFKYEEGGVKLSLKKTADFLEAAVPVGQDRPALRDVPEIPEAKMVPGKEETGTVDGNIVKSPLIGTFYTSPSEDASPFVKIGDDVKEGQVLAIVEAMKLMNEIESDFAGTITDILVENGDAVEYGQPLFVIN